jgi:hypothetical protein
MVHQIKPDTPSHSRGTHKGEGRAESQREPGREGKTATARSATSINPKAHEPIDPRMPHLPPA